MSICIDVKKGPSLGSRPSHLCMHLIVWGQTTQLKCALKQGRPGTKARKGPGCLYCLKNALPPATLLKCTKHQWYLVLANISIIMFDVCI